MMSMGMSVDEFWDGDYEYAKYYKKAHELRREMENESMWLNGMYMISAIQNAMNPRRAKYPKEPFPLNTSVSEERKELAQEQNERKVTDYFMTFMEQFNKRFEQKKNEQTGSAV